MHIVLFLVNGERQGIVVIVKTQCKLLKCAHIIIALSYTGHRENSRHLKCAQALRSILDAGTFFCERCIIKLAKLGIWKKTEEEEHEEEERGKNSQWKNKKETYSLLNRKNPKFQIYICKSHMWWAKEFGNNYIRFFHFNSNGQFNDTYTHAHTHR